jgi:hypothetical protein
VVHSHITAGPEICGILLGAIGAGAVVAPFGLPWAQRQLGADRLVAAGTGGTVLALVLFGVARDATTSLMASVLAGVSWIAVLSSLNVSAQAALPEWVRARGLAVYDGLTRGAYGRQRAVGQVAQFYGLPIAHFITAAGAPAIIPLTWRWHLLTGGDVDLTPSLHWQPPVISGAIKQDRGPVLVTVEYRIDPAKRRAFLTELDRLGHERRRDGAYAWGVFEDAADPARFVETFLVESWLEHLRQYERVTNADRVLQAPVQRFHLEGAPKVTHMIAAEQD